MTWQTADELAASIGTTPHHVHAMGARGASYQGQRVERREIAPGHYEYTLSPVIRRRPSTAWIPATRRLTIVETDVLSERD